MLRAAPRRLATLSLTAAMAVLVPLAPASARTALEPVIPTFGTTFHAVWPQYSNAGRERVLDRLAAAGVEWVRIDMMWKYAEPSAGVDDPVTYGRLDFAVDQARARGLKVLIDVFGTPGWANGGKGTTVPPSDASAFGRFAERLASRYRGRVSAWEVWNEPNLSRFWTGSVDEYVALLKAGYAGLKAGDPGARVLLGGISQNDYAFLSKAYAAGAKGFFDVLATHVYTGPSDAPPETDWSYNATATLRNVMVRAGDSVKPIWFTEFGWSTHVNDGSERPWERGVSEQLQADYLARALRLVAERYPYVTQMFWYMERDVSYWNDQEDGFGLLGEDLSPKLAYTTVRELFRPAS